MANYTNDNDRMIEAIDSAIENLNNMSEEEFLSRLKGCDNEVFDFGLNHTNHIQDPRLVEQISEAQNSLLEELDKTSNEELISQLESCEDNSITYAISPELGDDSFINKNDK